MYIFNDLHEFINPTITLACMLIYFIAMYNCISYL